MPSLLKLYYSDPPPPFILFFAIFRQLQDTKTAVTKEIGRFHSPLRRLESRSDDIIHSQMDRREGLSRNLEAR